MVINHVYSARILRGCNRGMVISTIYRYLPIHLRLVCCFMYCFAGEKPEIVVWLPGYGRKEGRKGRKEGRKWRKEGRKGRKEGRRGRKEGRKGREKDSLAFFLLPAHSFFIPPCPFVIPSLFLFSSSSSSHEFCIQVSFLELTVISFHLNIAGSFLKATELKVKNPIFFSLA